MPTTPVVERAVFPAMGNTAKITIVDGEPSLVDFAQIRLRELESLWSRFIPASDISRLNLASGMATHVAPETVRLIRHMVGGWTLTHGLFDPSMLGELVGAGYGRSLTSDALTILPTGIEWSKDLADVTIEGDVAELPFGLTLDPGGIGKGLAADILANELIDRGASGALVSVGGDIRCIGRGDIDDRWIIDIESPFDRRPLCSIEISEGAVATSSLTAKMFSDPRMNNGMNCHILDPISRSPVDFRSRDVVQATVVAGECVWAEVFTKALLVLNEPKRIELVAEHGLDAMVVRTDGTTVASHGWRRYQP